MRLDSQDFKKDARRLTLEQPSITSDKLDLLQKTKKQSEIEEMSNPQTSLLRKLEMSSKYNIFTEKEFVIIMQKMIIYQPPPESSDESSGEDANSEASKKVEKKIEDKHKKNRMLLMQLGVIQEVKKNTAKKGKKNKGKNKNSRGNKNNKGQKSSGNNNKEEAKGQQTVSHDTTVWGIPAEPQTITRWICSYCQKEFRLSHMYQRFRLNGRNVFLCSDCAQWCHNNP